MISPRTGHQRRWGSSLCPGQTQEAYLRALVLGNRLVSHSEAAYWPVCPQIPSPPSPALCLRELTPAAALKWACQRETWPVTGGQGAGEAQVTLLFFLCCEQGLWGRLSPSTPAPSCSRSAPVSVPTRWSSLTGSGNSTFSLRPSLTLEVVATVREAVNFQVAHIPLHISAALLTLW